MDPIMIGILGLVAFFTLIAFGMPVAFSGFIVGLGGVWVMVGSEAALSVAGTIPADYVAKYTWAVLPLFILMGQFALHTGIAHSAFMAGRQWLGRLPGGLASATCVAAALFGAACGSAMAATTVFTKVALPELEKAKYDTKLSVGCVTSVGGLAAVIPPSGLVVVFGIMTEQPIGKLLMAGFIPGAVIATAFILLITLRVMRNHSLGPPIYGVTWKDRLVSVKGLWPITLLAVLVMGGIYTGVFTPTEAGAAGAVLALIIALGMRRLSLSIFWDSLQGAARSTGMIFIIIVGMATFARFLAITGLPFAIGNALVALPLPALGLLLVILAFYVVLGMFMDPMAMLILTVPVFFPAIQALGISPILFGILVVIMCEVGTATPPVGTHVYLTKALAPHIPIQDIFRGAIPFVLTTLACVALFAIFPDIALVLPRMMAG
ncbi:TRAP transporter large permease [Chloroflexota bacterium]